MSLTTNIVATGLSRKGAELIQERLDEWNAANGIEGYRADQKLVEIGDHAGGLKSFGSILAACFNYGPSPVDWQAWFNEAIDKLYDSPVVTIEQEGDQVTYVHGHGWIERVWSEERV